MRKVPTKNAGQTEQIGWEVDQAIDTMRHTIVPYVVSAIVGASIMAQSVPYVLVAIWFMWYAIHIVAHIQLTYAYFRQTLKQRTQNIRRWKRLLLAVSCSLGTLWGAVPLIAFPFAVDSDFQLLWTFMIAALYALLAAVAIPSQLVVFLLFTVPALSLSWFFWGGQMAGGMVVLYLFFVLTYLFINVQQSQANFERWSITVENEHLFKELAVRNETLEQINRSKTELLAVASHDLRQPAHALGLLVELMDEANPQAGQETLESIRLCVGSLHEMLSQLLDFNHLEFGIYRPRVEAISIDALCTEIAGIYTVIAQRKHLTFSTQGVVPIFGKTDSRLFHRILSNLVHNAIKFTPQGGVVIAWNQVDDMVEINITDTGVGISPENIDKVFNDFVRFDAGTDVEQGFSLGLGLGLAIVQKGCQLLGHTLSVRSSVGVGTSFTLRVEATAQHLVLPESTPTVEASGTGETILVIDNDPIALSSLMTMLARRGWLPKGAQSLDQLLEQVDSQSSRPCLIISDLHIAGPIDGLAAVAVLRQHFGMLTLPAVLLTGDVDPAVETRCRNQQVFLAHKPLRPSRLFSLITEAITNQLPDCPAGETAIRLIPDAVGAAHKAG